MPGELAACILPVAARHVELGVTVDVEAEGSLVNGLVNQAPFQRFFGCLRPLRRLEHLNLSLCPWRLTEAVVTHLIQRHPALRTLQLYLTTAPIVGAHAVDSLHQLSLDELSLTLCMADGNPVALLRQISGLQLHTLTIIASSISRAEESMLARCTMQQLVVQLPHPAMRLRRPPPGLAVVYDPRQD